MKALLVLLIAWLLPAVAQAAPIRMTVEPAATGVRITYDLPAPVRSFAIRAAAQSGPAHIAHIVAVEPGLSYRGGRIEAAVPFRRATLLLTPDDAEVDSVYPLLTRIAGRGFVLYAPYVTPDGPLAASVAVGGGRSRTLSRTEAEHGYVLVGTSPAARGAVRGVAGTTLPPALEARLFDRAGALLTFYTRRLGRRPFAAPTLVVEYVNAPAGPTQWLFRGDVTPNGIVFLRFHATPAQLAETQSTNRYTAFLAHELFHLWNRRTGQHAMAEAWLHEGSAEYFAWLATDALWPGEIDLSAKLSQSLSSCGAFLANRGLMQLEDGEAMQRRYDCGPIVQWVADAGVRAASRGRRTGFDLWAGLLRNARGDYSVAAFLAAARAQAPATAAFLSGLIESGTRWDMLAPTLTAAGAGVEAPPARRANVAFAATRAVVRAMCREFWGGGLDDQGPYFSSGACEMPGNFTHIARIDGADPNADVDAFYAHVRDVCARGEELVLVLRGEDGETRRTVRCNVPPAPAPLDFRIARPLPFSPPARSAP